MIVRGAVRERPWKLKYLALEWYGLLGGAIGWTAHLLISVPLVAPACEAGATWPLHLVTIVTVAFSLGAAGAAWWVWRQALPDTRDAQHERQRRAPAAPSAEKRDEEAILYQAEPPDARGMENRARFMGITGMLISGLFVIVTLAEGLPVFFIDPCVSHVVEFIR